MANFILKIYEQLELDDFYEYDALVLADEIHDEGLEVYVFTNKIISLLTEVPLLLFYYRNTSIYFSIMNQHMNEAKGKSEKVF